MPRATTGKVHHKRREKILKDVQGFYGAGKTFSGRRRTRGAGAAELIQDRRRRKRDFRTLWIIRINAAARLNGISYSRLIAGMEQAGITMNRKLMADLAVSDPNAFAQIVNAVKEKVS